MMDRERTWTKDGVTVTYRTYNTQHNLIVSETLTKAFRVPTPTEENPDLHSIPSSVQMFYLAMPTIVKVECEPGAALWGEILKEEIENPSFLEDPVADYKRIQRTAPAEMLLEVEVGYIATREKKHLAPEELRNDPPENPDLDLERKVQVGQIDASHPTIIGGGLSKKKSSVESATSSGTSRKAK